jgi:hypothetical protein
MASSASSAAAAAAACARVARALPDASPRRQLEIACACALRDREAHATLRNLCDRRLARAAYAQRAELRVQADEWRELLFDPANGTPDRLRAFAEQRALRAELEAIEAALGSVASAEAACESPGAAPRAHRRALAYLAFHSAQSSALLEMIYGVTLRPRDARRVDAAQTLRDEAGDFEGALPVCVLLQDLASAHV